MAQRVVIIGASLAGLAAVAGLRSGGYEGSIVVLDSEPELPPDRPPLTKQVLSGAWTIERAAQPLASRLTEYEVDLQLGHRVVSLDMGDATGGHRVVTESGAWDAAGVVIATGSHPRPLPEDWRLDGVHTIRGRTDTAALLASLGSTSGRVLVVGAGVIGLEAAATLRSAGREVTVVEPQPNVLARVLSPDVGEWVANVHRRRGVDLRTATAVERMLIGTRGEFAGAALSDGTSIAADVAIVGIGVLPSTAWLEGSGLVIDNGIVCDETLAAAPGVVAAGDVARWPHPAYGELVRLEHWDNAIESGTFAGRRLASSPPFSDRATHEAFAPVPYFWTDQYDTKVQVAGRIEPDAESVVIDGSLDGDRAVLAFRRGDRLGAVLGVNRPAPVVRWRVRMAVEGGVPFDDALAQR